MTFEDCLNHVDCTVRECAGGWIVHTPEYDEKTEEFSYGAHVFVELDTALKHIKERMEWLKSFRLKARFNKSDDDYEGSPEIDVTPPVIRNTRNHPKNRGC